MSRVLFVCTGNACRSPMAEGWARALGLQAESGGVLAAGVHPTAVRVMEESGIDISEHVSRVVDPHRDDFDFVVTLCDYARSVFPDRPVALQQRLHWPVDDPIHSVGTGRELDDFRRARDEIRRILEDNLSVFQSR